MGEARGGREEGRARGGRGSAGGRRRALVRAADLVALFLHQRGPEASAPCSLNRARESEGGRESETHRGDDLDVGEHALLDLGFGELGVQRRVRAVVQGDLGLERREERVGEGAAGANAGRRAGLASASREGAVRERGRERERRSSDARIHPLLERLPPPLRQALDPRPIHVGHLCEQRIEVDARRAERLRDGGRHVRRAQGADEPDPAAVERRARVRGPRGTGTGGGGGGGGAARARGGGGGGGGARGGGGRRLAVRARRVRPVARVEPLALALTVAVLARGTPALALVLSAPGLRPPRALGRALRLLLLLGAGAGVWLVGERAALALVARAQAALGRERGRRCGVGAARGRAGWRGGMGGRVGAGVEESGVVVG